MVRKRRDALGGAGHRDRRWLLTGVLMCGDCGHKFWGDPKKKGHIEGRAEVLSNYYVCSGRRSHGKTICQVPSTLRAESMEAWLLDRLAGLVLDSEEQTNAAIDRFVAAMMGESAKAPETERIAAEPKKLNETVTALTMNVDPANIGLLNDRRTQLRLRKEHLEQELRTVEQSEAKRDEKALRKWAREKLAGLRDAQDGRRDDWTRDALGAFVEQITVWPSKRRGEVKLTPFAVGLWKRSDRPERRSCGYRIGAKGFEPSTSWSRTRRSSQAELRPGHCEGYSVFRPSAFSGSADDDANYLV